MPPKLFSHYKENDGIEVINLESDLVFLTPARVKDFLYVGRAQVALGRAKEEQSVHAPAFNTVHGAFVYVVQHNMM